MRKARILVATALAIAASAAGAAAAREPSMREPARLEAELGFDGHFVPDRWAPLWLRSEGAPGARIEVERRGANGSDIGRESFPAGDGQRIECPVPMTVDLETIAVRLVSGDGILAEVKLDARSNAFPGNLALACGLPVSARLAISSALMPGEPVQAVAVGTDELPANGLDYDGVGALALADPGSVLSPAQREALLAWIAGGGGSRFLRRGRRAKDSSARSASGTEPAWGTEPAEASFPSAWAASFGCRTTSPTSPAPATEIFGGPSWGLRPTARPRVWARPPSARPRPFNRMPGRRIPSPPPRGRTSSPPSALGSSSFSPPPASATRPLLEWARPGSGAPLRWWSPRRSRSRSRSPASGPWTRPSCGVRRFEPSPS